MYNLVITEVNLVAGLSQSTLLDYLDDSEIKFLISDICYKHKTFAINDDKSIAEKIIRDGMLRIVSLNEFQMVRLGKYFDFYKPQFLPKTISALILAKDLNAKLISDDELLRATAIEDFGIQAFNSQWLLGTIVREIAFNTGLKIDLELLKELHK